MTGTDQAQDGGTAALEAAVRLAHVLCRPLDHCADELLPRLPLPPSELRALAADPAFRGPVNRAVAAARGLGRLALAETAFVRLAERPASRLALLLVTEPAERVGAAGLRLAGAILHRRVAALVMKPDRQRARDTLGPDAFAIATVEAPMMHARLAELDLTPPQRSDIVAFEDPAAVRRFASAAVERFIAVAEPELLPFLRARFGSFAGEPVGAASAAHGEQILKLLRRSMSPWQARIG